MALSRAFWVLAIAVGVLLVVTVVPVILIAIVASLVIVTAAFNALLARFIGQELGCLVGGLAALGWVWLLSQVSDRPTLVVTIGVGVPAVAWAAARRFGSDRPPRPTAP